MAGFDILDVVGDPWNDVDSVFGGIKLSITDTASRYNSKFLELMLDGSTRFTIWKTGETFLSNSAGTSHGGFALRGNLGEMALTSLYDQNTGNLADVVRYYWENSTRVGSHPDSVAVIRGMGNNRLSIESNGAMVHIARNGRYEFEAETSGVPIQFVGYRAASGDGLPFLFNNFSQTAYAASVVQMGVRFATQDALQVGTWDGTTFTAGARFDGSGMFYARGGIVTAPQGTTQGIGVQPAGDNVARMFVGVNVSGYAFLGFGNGTKLDSRILRTGVNTFALGGATADFPAIKRSGTTIQARLATDSDFAPLQGKLTTDQTAVTETITADSTLTLYDASGTAYKVPCVAA